MLYFDTDADDGTDSTGATFTGIPLTVESCTMDWALENQTREPG